MYIVCILHTARWWREGSTLKRPSIKERATARALQKPRKTPQIGNVDHENISLMEGSTLHQRAVCNVYVCVLWSGCTVSSIADRHLYTSDEIFDIKIPCLTSILCTYFYYRGYR